ncbi:hypothetical protein [Thioalkalivibrio sp. ALE19]|uniref:hypothetical protein n=1 Tax=Thioalkalivibrio sp. ALE19 TaxID=1266909 RepID=UPI00048B58D9|nr:hypothetical protein [Thioalkalivibrio sp. ALE19]
MEEPSMFISLLVLGAIFVVLGVIALWVSDVFDPPMPGKGQTAKNGNKVKKERASVKKERYSGMAQMKSRSSTEEYFMFHDQSKCYPFSDHSSSSMGTGSDFDHH